MTDVTEIDEEEFKKLRRSGRKRKATGPAESESAPKAARIEPRNPVFFDVGEDGATHESKEVKTNRWFAL